MFRKRAIHLLFLHHKKEKYQALGYEAFVQNLFGRQELFVLAKPKSARHGEFIT